MSHDRHPKVATPDHEVLDLITHRWSPRAFESASPIDLADVRRLFEAARWAPSSANEQPWRFVYADPWHEPSAHAALLASLSPKNQVWARHASALILVAVRATFERLGVVNTMAHYDTGQAVAFLSLQATAMGLAIRQMQGFDAAQARIACGVPEPFDPAVVMAMGRRGDPERLEVDIHRDAEHQPRQRRPLADFVFAGTWATRFEP